MIVPVYVSELSPKHIRGRLTTLNTLVITFGQVTAYVMNIAFASVPNGWRYMFGIAGIPALFQFIIMPFLPESPRRLIAIKKYDEAKSAIRKVYGNSVTDTFIDREIKIIDDDIHACRSGSFKDFLHRDNFMPLMIGEYTIYICDTVLTLFKKKPVYYKLLNNFQVLMQPCIMLLQYCKWQVLEVTKELQV